MFNEEQTIDLRVKRTRMMIETAFMELLEEQDFQSITVRAITDRAMVNRATFYDHFTDKYALFELTIRNSFQQVLESKLPKEFVSCENHFSIIVIVMCEFVAQINDHCRQSKPKGLPPFDEQVIEFVKELMLMWFEENPNMDRADLLAEMVSRAMYGAAKHWNMQKPRESVDTFAISVTPMLLALIGEHEPVIVS